jgi:hypothetical protein
LAPQHETCHNVTTSNPQERLDDSDERFQLGDSSEGSMAQLNPTSDTDTTAAIDSGA